MYSKQIPDIFHDYTQEVLHHQQQYRACLAADSVIAHCDQRIGELGLEKLGLAIAGSDTTQIDRRLTELEKKREDRAARLGLSPYRCSLCRDTGYLDGDFCTCVRQRIYADHYRSQQLEAVGQTLTDYPFDAFDDRNPVAGVGVSSRRLTWLGVQAFQELLDHYPNNGRGILLYGLAGVGKTYMLLAAAHEAWLRSLDVLYVSAAGLHDLYLRQRFHADVDMHYLETSGLLFLDDLGAEPMIRNVTRESLHHLLEVRASLNLPTAITTNLKLDALHDRYGERLCSRLSDGRRFLFAQLGGVDLRTGREHQKDSLQRAGRSSEESVPRKNVPPLP